MVGSGGHGSHGIHHVQDLCRPLHFQTHTHCYQLHVRQQYSFNRRMNRFACKNINFDVKRKKYIYKTVIECGKKMSKYILLG